MMDNQGEGTAAPCPSEALPLLAHGQFPPSHAVHKIQGVDDGGRGGNAGDFPDALGPARPLGIGDFHGDDLYFRHVHRAEKSAGVDACGLLRSVDVPEIEVIAVEVPDPEGPCGAKGIGEIACIPTAPAIVNALYLVDGVRRRELPVRKKR